MSSTAYIDNILVRIVALSFVVNRPSDVLRHFHFAVVLAIVHFLLPSTKEKNQYTEAISEMHTLVQSVAPIPLFWRALLQLYVHAQLSLHQRLDMLSMLFPTINYKDDFSILLKVVEHEFKPIGVIVVVACSNQCI